QRTQPQRPSNSVKVKKRTNMAQNPCTMIIITGDWGGRAGWRSARARKVRDWASLPGSGGICYRTSLPASATSNGASVQRFESHEPRCERVAERDGRCDLQVISLEVHGYRLGGEFRDNGSRAAVGKQHLPVDAGRDGDPPAGADEPPQGAGERTGGQGGLPHHGE